MPLIAHEYRCGPALFECNVLCLPKVCPDDEKPPFSPAMEQILECNFLMIFMPHRQAEPNLSCQPRFLPSTAKIENP